MENDYPYADLSIEYPERTDRLTAFFRFFLALPVMILFGLLTGAYAGKCGLAGGGFLFLPVLLAILLRNKYPRVWFDGLLSFKIWDESDFLSFLLRDEIPSIEDEQCVK
jgi:hypothetical protein